MRDSSPVLGLVLASLIPVNGSLTVTALVPVIVPAASCTSISSSNTPFLLVALSNSYHDMWRDDYLAIEKSYRKEDILYIRYEDLRNNSTRLKVGQTLAHVAAILTSTLIRVSFLVTHTSHAS